MNQISTLVATFSDQENEVIDNIEVFYEVIDRKINKESLKKILLSIAQINYYVPNENELIKSIGNDISKNDIDIIVKYAEQLTDLMDTFIVYTDEEGGY